MQHDKLLLPVHEVPAVERVIRAAAGSGLGETILVWRVPAVKAIGETCGVRTVCNPEAAAGQSASVRYGLAAAHKRACGWMFLVGDQPFVTAGLIDVLIDAARKNPVKIIVPDYEGLPGNPVIFPVRFREQLLGLQGDEGGRAVIRRFPGDVLAVPVKNAVLGLDIDTSEAYNKALDISMKKIDKNNI